MSGWATASTFSRVWQLDKLLLPREGLLEFGNPSVEDLATSRYWGPRQVGQGELETSLAQGTISPGPALCYLISLLKTAS